jgi:hypothetical protein
MDAQIPDIPQPEKAAPPEPKLWWWVVSAVSVVLIGVLSARSGARVPFLSGVDFGFHELGHFVLWWAPWRITAIAGSVTQVAFPLALAAYFLFDRHEPWAAAPLLAWAGASARNVAVYIADAPFQRLELWGGPAVQHDWATLLAGPPLRYAGAIAGTVEAVGWLMIVAALALATVQPIREALAASRAKRRAAADEARHATLPVREPHGPIG